MAYTITFEPQNRVSGVGPSKTIKETAAAALQLVTALEADNEEVTA